MAGILVSSSYALSPAEVAELWKPIIGWGGYITASNISADFETSDDPASNLGNPSTSYRWTSSSTDTQHVTALFGSEQYVSAAAIERHNWQSAGITVSIEGLPFGGDPNEPTDWVELFEEHVLSDDGARMWRFTRTPLIGLRWKLQGASVPPFAAVAYCGEHLTLPYGVPPGHVPIKFADITEHRHVGAQGGDHLGIAIISRRRSGNIVQQFIDPAVYRSKIEPFRLHFRDGGTFFFAWAPADHPDEVGYCWRGGDATPTVSQATGLVDITFPIMAVAL